ncbi:MAG: hypothetical protein QW279_07825 [Candidatus Jordarchaeaceae archaeon]
MFEFPPEVEEEIFKRDGYRCVIYGRGREDGVKIHSYRIDTLDKDETNNADNGLTLCSEHKILRKTYSQIEFSKVFFLKLYLDSVSKGDKRMINFARKFSMFTTNTK